MLIHRIGFKMFSFICTYNGKQFVLIDFDIYHKSLDSLICIIIFFLKIYKISNLIPFLNKTSQSLALLTKSQSINHFYKESYNKWQCFHLKQCINNITLNIFFYKSYK